MKPFLSSLFSIFLKVNELGLFLITGGILTDFFGGVISILRLLLST
jgi:hypothetical protein